MDELQVLRPLPRMRSAEQCYQEIKKSDPGSRVTRWLIRDLAKKGKISVTWIGENRMLINYDSLLTYLSSPHPIADDNASPISPIPEKLQRR